MGGRISLGRQRLNKLQINMKVQVRKGTFETNSSSIHTIAIAKGTYQDGIELYKVVYSDMPLKFELCEFGWEAEKYSSFYERASYLWTMACSDSFEDAIKRRMFIEETLLEQGIKSEFQPVVEEKYTSGGTYCLAEDQSWFGIDHSDEWNDFKRRIFSDKELLLDFLFGDAFILTYNDNDDYADWLMLEDQDDGIERDYYTKGN